MAKQRKTRRTPMRRIEHIPVDFEISYKNYEKLDRYINDRAKIIGQKRSGLSAKQQRLLTREIKRARHLGLLPYKASL